MTNINNAVTLNCPLTEAGVLGALLLGSGELSTAERELVDPAESIDSFSWLISVSCCSSSSVSDSRVLSNISPSSSSSLSVSSSFSGVAGSTDFRAFSRVVDFSVMGLMAATGGTGCCLTASVELSSVRSMVTLGVERIERILRLIKESRGPRPFTRAGPRRCGRGECSTSFSPSETLGSEHLGATGPLVLLGSLHSLISGFSLLKVRRAGGEGH